jgi:hypothetical protein
MVKKKIIYNIVHPTRIFAWRKFKVLRNTGIFGWYNMTISKINEVFISSFQVSYINELETKPCLEKFLVFWLVYSYYFNSLTV